MGPQRGLCSQAELAILTAAAIDDGSGGLLSMTGFIQNGIHIAQGVPGSGPGIGARGQPQMGIEDPRAGDKDDNGQQSRQQATHSVTPGRKGGQSKVSVFSLLSAWMSDEKITMRGTTILRNGTAVRMRRDLSVRSATAIPGDKSCIRLGVLIKSFKCTHPGRRDSGRQEEQNWIE